MQPFGATDQLEALRRARDLSNAPRRARSLSSLEARLEQKRSSFLSARGDGPLMKKPAAVASFCCVKTQFKAISIMMRSPLLRKLRATGKLWQSRERAIGQGCGEPVQKRMRKHSAT